MKILYNILAVILGTFLFLVLFPLMYAIIQFGLVILFFIGQILILPLCVYLVYWSWKKATKGTEIN